MTKKDEVHQFWNDQAKGGFQAGSRDVTGKALEMRVLKKNLRDGLRVLEVGCGNGVTAFDLCETYALDYTGIDYAEVMIDEAKKKLNEISSRLKCSPGFQVGDLRQPPHFTEKFDIVLTERVLINLETWEEQRQAIQKISSYLKPGGFYLMCENSQNALDRINELRTSLSLPSIAHPWHNLYFQEEALKNLNIPELVLDRVDPFSSTYYFLSRVINARLCADEGKEPQYEAPINQLSFKLPVIGNFSQVTLWVWRKK